MPNDLRTQIHTFAAQFATEVLKAIRGASLEDILNEATASPSRHASAATPVKRGRGRPKGSKKAAPFAAKSPQASHPAAAASGTPAKRGPGRPEGTKNSAAAARRTSTLSVIESITAYVAKHAGTSGEAARKALNIDRNKWSPAVAKAVAEKRIRKEGEKRSTKYWVV